MNEVSEMGEELLIGAMKEMLIIALLIAAPALTAAFITGLVVGILQAATGIQEITLTFVPKLLAVIAVAFLFAGTAVTLMRQLMQSLWQFILMVH